MFPPKQLSKLLLELFDMVYLFFIYQKIQISQQKLYICFYSCMNYELQLAFALGLACTQIVRKN